MSGYERKNLIMMMLRNILSWFKYLWMSTKLYFSLSQALRAFGGLITRYSMFLDAIANVLL